MNAELEPQWILDLAPDEEDDDYEDESGELAEYDDEEEEGDYDYDGDFDDEEYDDEED